MAKKFITKQILPGRQEEQRLLKHICLSNAFGRGFLVLLPVGLIGLSD